MKHQLMKIPSMLLVLLLLSAHTGIAQLEEYELDIFNDTIIVDDDGDGDFSTIKEALDHATSNDTILVYSGIYKESGLEITQENLSVIGIPYELGDGDAVGKPFINGGGKHSVLLINNNGIVFSGFHIENLGDNNCYDGIIIRWERYDNVISNNDITNIMFACIACYGSHNKIINNNISHSILRCGIVLLEKSDDIEQPTHNLISGNNITNIHLQGINLWDAHNNTITNNFISQCSRVGIHIGGTHNTVKLNTISESPRGIDTGSDYNQIIQNNFFENNRHVFLTAPIENILIDGNYWGRSRFLPKPVFGWRDLSPPFFDIPWLFFDWHPALRPYVI